MDQPFSPRGPGNPLGPTGPGAPVKPISPFSPVKPMSPFSPGKPILQIIIGWSDVRFVWSESLNIKITYQHDLLVQYDLFHQCLLCFLNLMKMKTLNKHIHPSANRSLTNKTVSQYDYYNLFLIEFSPEMIFSASLIIIIKISFARKIPI